MREPINYNQSGLGQGARYKLLFNFNSNNVKLFWNDSQLKTFSLDNVKRIVPAVYTFCKEIEITKMVKSKM